MLQAILKEYEKGFWWIPALYDRKGRRIPLQAFLDLKSELDPHADHPAVRATLFTINHIIENYA